ncbi:hypothetical protein LguiA_008368 [Lonicera macranthoides]
MAVARAQETSSSTCYDVFLSFRGEDTRKTFTDHLYTALVQQGFHTFRDNDEIEKGEYLKSELEKAICRSKISIIVISKDYASSTWCLDELMMILEQRRNSEHVVLPVFYDVDPSEVRKQTGRTAEAFAKYKEQINAEMDHEVKTKLMKKIKGWRLALTEVADLIGLDLQNQVDGYIINCDNGAVNCGDMADNCGDVAVNGGDMAVCSGYVVDDVAGEAFVLYEAKFIQKIIKVIGDKLRHKTLDVAQYETGIDSRAKSINLWLQNESTDVRVRAICGMGGIGKTTIAKFVYNQNSDSFESSSFLANIREVLEQPNGLLCLQRQLILDISKKQHKKIHNVDEGLAKIKKLVCSKRVLLVLDDVEQADQIYTIFGMEDKLFPGSKVIITTRHERLLKPHQMYKVNKLTKDESIKLFSLHAFGKDCPIQSYKKHTKRAVKFCEGLPLALKVIGSSLSGKSEKEWVNELGKLEKIPHSQILKKLKSSYDSLQDDYDKRLFLHIACFFVGIDKDYAIKILEKCNLHAKVGIQNIIDRCLITIDHSNVLGMHQLIQDMGREIIHQESQDAGERSRLWHHWDAFTVLKNETGTKTVEGLALDMRILEEADSNAKKHLYEEFCHNSIMLKHVSSLKRCWFSFISGQSVSTTSPNDVCLRTDAFKIELSLENLVALDLRHSRLELVWKQTSFLESLKILDLSYSKWLTRTPNFLSLPNLESLILKGCASLVEVCESIGNLEMLDLLDLQDCKSLRKFPRNIGKLGSLRTLVISGCNIGELPNEMRNDGDNKWWPLTVWSIVPTPRKGPDTLWASLPYSLRELCLNECNLYDDSFPENFGNLPSLQYLSLERNPFRRIPNCIKSLNGLQGLNISECHRLQSLELNGLSINSRMIIEAGSCESLENVTSLNGNSYLWLYGCHKLVDLEVCFEKEIPIVLGITTLTRRRKYPIQGRFENENKTKDLSWIYCPQETFPGDEYMVEWLSRWRFGNQLEAGDEITITFDGNDEYVVEKCGFKIVYQEEHEEENGSSSATIEESHHDYNLMSEFLSRCMPSHSLGNVQEKEENESSSSAIEESHHDYNQISELFSRCMQSLLLSNMQEEEENGSRSSTINVQEEEEHGSRSSTIEESIHDLMSEFSSRLQSRLLGYPQEEEENGSNASTIEDSYHDYNLMSEFLSRYMQLLSLGDVQEGP